MKYEVDILKKHVLEQKKRRNNNISEGCVGLIIIPLLHNLFPNTGVRLTGKRVKSHMIVSLPSTAEASIRLDTESLIAGE